MEGKLIFSKPKSLRDTPMRYCPGCSHGTLHRIIAETIDHFGIRERTVGIAPVGCAVFAYDYFYFDMIEVAHGRPPAAATGMKRAAPDKIIFCYQGDGDLAAIGTAEIVHAANRGENLTVIFVNNGTYGMTGGQMAPTTLMGQRTTTTPTGRGSRDGYPLRVSEMLATLEGVTYIERVAMNSPKNTLKAKNAIKKAFQNQIEGKGFSLVEALSTCPTDWGLSPVDSLKWIEEKMIPYFPLAVFKDKKV